jgi:hypothetical protein
MGQIISKGFKSPSILRKGFSQPDHYVVGGQGWVNFEELFKVSFKHALSRWFYISRQSIKLIACVKNFLFQTLESRNNFVQFSFGFSKFYF